MLKIEQVWDEAIPVSMQKLALNYSLLKLRQLVPSSESPSSETKLQWTVHQLNSPNWECTHKYDAWMEIQCPKNVFMCDLGCGQGKKNGVLKIHTPYHAVALSAYCPAKPIKFTFPKSSLSHEIAYNEQTLTWTTFSWSETTKLPQTLQLSEGHFKLTLR